VLTAREQTIKSRLLQELDLNHLARALEPDSGIDPAWMENLAKHLRWQKWGYILPMLIGLNGFSIEIFTQSEINWWVMGGGIGIIAAGLLFLGRVNRQRSISRILEEFVEEEVGVEGQAG